MAESLYIDNNNNLDPSEDYYFLKQEGIRMIQDLAGKVWTDYNTHDPGITLLEAFCYALTELGYLASFDMQDLLAGGDKKSSWSDIFYTARQALCNAPVTLSDYRKLVIDVEGVRNAWVEISDRNEATIYIQQDDAGHSSLSLSPVKYTDPKLYFKGLYKVFLEWDDDIQTDEQRTAVMEKVNHKIQQHRGLCEDFVSIAPADYALFAIAAELKVSEGVVIEEVNAKVFQVIHDFISPAIRFYSLEQMLEKNYTVEEIFEGPALRHGFIDTAELEASARNKQVHVADVVKAILSIPGVIAITQFSLPAGEDTAFSDFNDFLSSAHDQRKIPALDTANSVITFSRNGDRYRSEQERTANKDRVKALYDFYLLSGSRSKLKKHTRDFEVPSGDYMNWGGFYPVQLTLPAAYGMHEKVFEISTDKQTLEQELYAAVDAQKNNRRLSSKAIALLGAIKNTGKTIKETEKYVSSDNKKEIATLREAYVQWQYLRLDAGKKHSLQLRGFLLFFEQLLADYTRKLASLNQLFSFAPGVEQTYEPGSLTAINDFEHLFLDYPHYLKQQNTLVQSKAAGLQERRAMLDHILARFGETITDPDSNETISEATAEQMISTRSAFIRDFVQVSSFRGAGFDYSVEDRWNTDNVEGIKKRICRLVGIADYKRETLHPHFITVRSKKINGEEMYKVVLTDPATDTRLLASKNYTNPAEAYDTLNYILQYGAGKTLYTVSHRPPYSYALQRLSQENELEEIAARTFNEADEMETLFRRTLELLEAVSHRENFHMLEHILLRPRLVSREIVQWRNTPSQVIESIALLNPPGSVSGTAVTATPGDDLPYKFRVVNDDAAGGWRVSLVETSMLEREVLVVDEVFAYDSHVVKRIRNIQQQGGDRARYKVETGDGLYYFSIEHDNITLARGKALLPEAGLNDLITNLVDFFSYNTSETDDEDTDESALAAQVDPYSFQLSVFLPNWPARFRDISYRHLLEKTIFLEVPAHINVSIYWLNFEQVREFESGYKRWLDSQDAFGYADLDAVNRLVSIVNKIAEQY